MGFRTKSAELASYFRMGINTYRGRLLIQSSFWVAAICTGIAAVYFADWIEVIQADFFRVFSIHPYVMSIWTPVAFVLAVGVVKLLAPWAGGSGLPQVLHASSLPNTKNQDVARSGLLSTRTAIVKVLSTTIGYLGGASIGGEGPTVQISGSIFAVFGDRVRKRFPNVDFHSYMVAAAGAGIASAFNTPLGGVVFALEEVAVGDFGELRHMVMLAVIVAGLTGQAIVGDKLYFGEPNIQGVTSSFLLWAVVIGVIGGICGGIFARLVSSNRWSKLKIAWWKRALLCGAIVSGVGLLFHGGTAGSGYVLTKDFIEGHGVARSVAYPLAKLVATAASTMSGMGGGILSPSLSVGAWLGISTAKLALFNNINACALLGMVAYFTGAFQIPMTAVVVVMEMTNEHAIVFPMMVAALVSFIVSHAMMPTPMYHILIKRMFPQEQIPSNLPREFASKQASATSPESPSIPANNQL